MASNDNVSANENVYNNSESADEEGLPCKILQNNENGEYLVQPEIVGNACSNNHNAAPYLAIPQAQCVLPEVKPTMDEDADNDSTGIEPPVNSYDSTEEQDIGTHESDSEPGIYHLRRSRSDELLTIKHHWRTRRHYETEECYSPCISDSYGYTDVSDAHYTCSSRDDDLSSDSDANNALYRQDPRLGMHDAGRQSEDEKVNCERIVFIENEYVNRIAILEERQYELEDVLAKLNSAMENLCMSPTRGSPCIQTDRLSAPADTDNVDLKEDEDGAVGGCKGTGQQQSEDMFKDVFGNDADGKSFDRALSLQLYMEFQQKIRNFATDLAGVLNCSEAAIRHARVIQEWATEVQRIFDQLKEDRHKLQLYIAERERSLSLIREQFSNELQKQDYRIRQLVDELKKNETLSKKAEKYAEKKAGAEIKQSVSDSHPERKIIDLLLNRRMQEDKAIVINMAKQSKISELKLFIVHQQTCIQQLQEQNRELRAIIEGLMGSADDTEEEVSSTDQTHPDKQSDEESPVICPVRETLDKLVENTDSLLSDVVYCDKGEYLPGLSTDGDIATIQIFDIGGEPIALVDADREEVFDPLTVTYVRDQCRKAEESVCQSSADGPSSGPGPVDPTLAETKPVNLEPEVEKTDDVKCDDQTSKKLSCGEPNPDCPIPLDTEKICQEIEGTSLPVASPGKQVLTVQDGGEKECVSSVDVGTCTSDGEIADDNSLKETPLDVSADCV